MEVCARVIGDLECEDLRFVNEDESQTELGRAKAIRKVKRSLRDMACLKKKRYRFIVACICVEDSPKSRYRAVTGNIYLTVVAVCISVEDSPDIYIVGLTEIK